MKTDGCVPLTDAQRDAVEENLDLCRRAAARFARKCRGAIPREEFLSDAYLGLVEAAGDYDESRGVPLWGFARHRVDGSCLDRMRRLGGRHPSSPRRRRVEPIDAVDPASGRPYADLIPDREHAEPPYSAEEHARLARSLARLGLEDRLTLARQYGLFGLVPRSHLYLVARLGTHSARVAQEQRAAIAKLRRTFEGSAAVPPPPPPRAPRSRIDHGTAIPIPEARANLMAAIAGRREDGALRVVVPLDEMLAALPPVRRLVVEMRHGLDGRARPLCGIGRELGKSYSVIHKAYGIGMRTLRDRLKETHP